MGSKHKGFIEHETTGGWMILMLLAGCPSHGYVAVNYAVVSRESELTTASENVTAIFKRVSDCLLIQ